MVSAFMTAPFYFNPRSLVGNDWVGGIIKVNDGSISIHVPSWGTTVQNDVFVVSWDISIHVPSWGTTQGRQRIRIRAAISIHVPSWGTTPPNFGLYTIPIISIHVPSWGTTAAAMLTWPLLLFQSTFPRGERRQIFTNILCFFMQ